MIQVKTEADDMENDVDSDDVLIQPDEGETDRKVCIDETNSIGGLKETDFDPTAEWMSIFNNRIMRNDDDETGELTPGYGESGGDDMSATDSDSHGEVSWFYCSISEKDQRKGSQGMEGLGNIKADHFRH